MNYDAAIEKLVADLARANELFKNNRGVGRMFAMSALERFLSGCKIKSSPPIESITRSEMDAVTKRHGLTKGLEYYEKVEAAAEVTLLNRRDGIRIKDALKDVSKRRHMDKGKLERLRNNIISARGNAAQKNASELACMIFELYLSQRGIKI